MTRTFTFQYDQTGRAATLRAQLYTAAGATVGALLSGIFSENGATGVYNMTTDIGATAACVVITDTADATTTFGFGVAAVAPTAAEVATAVETALSDDFNALPTAAENATAVQSQLNDDFAAIAAGVETRLVEEFAAIPAAVETLLVEEFAAIPAAVEAQLSGDFDAIPTAAETAAAVAAELAASVDPSVTVAVTHNYGAADALRIVDNGLGVDGVVIRAYVKSEFDAGPHAALVRQMTRTRADGRWEGTMYLDRGITYELTFQHPTGLATIRNETLAIPA